MSYSRSRPDSFPTTTDSTSTGITRLHDTNTDSDSRHEREWEREQPRGQDRERVGPRPLSGEYEYEHEHDEYEQYGHNEIVLEPKHERPSSAAKASSNLSSLPGAHVHGRRLRLDDQTQTRHTTSSRIDPPPLPPLPLATTSSSSSLSRRVADIPSIRVPALEPGSGSGSGSGRAYLSYPTSSLSPYEHPAAAATAASASSSSRGLYPFQPLLRGNPLPSTKTKSKTRANPSHRRPRHVINNTYLLRVVTRIRPTRPDTSTPLPTPTRPLHPRPFPPDSSREAFGARIHLSPQHFRLRPSGHLPHHLISHPSISTVPNRKPNSRTTVPARLHLQRAEHTSPHRSTTSLPSPRPLLHLLTHWQPDLTRARRCLKNPVTFPTRPINISPTLTLKPPLTPSPPRTPILIPTYLLSRRPDPHSAACHPSTSPTSPVQILSIPSSTRAPSLPLPSSAMPNVMAARKTMATNPGYALAHASSTPQTVSSSGSRRTGRTGGAKGNGWTMEHTYDSVGQKKEIIVIDDSATPEKIPRKRTRAVAAQEAAESLRKSALANGTGSSVATTVTGAAPGKKRKVADDVSDAGTVKKAKGKVSTSASNYAAPALVPKPQPAPVSQQSSTGPVWDDAEGHYIIKPDDIIGGRYKIVRLLGQGTFGKVVEARHVETRRKVAIKVIRAVQKYRDASKIEIRVLETLRRNDPQNLNKCIHLDEYFDFRNHPCLVSELYGMSVFDFLKQNAFQPFPEKHIQDFARSLLKSVDFLHRLKLVHTDLKPENILLVANESFVQGQRKGNSKPKRILKSTDIRLIDFGSATFENEYHSSVVSTRHYRAPEIILGLPWSYPCDMFSIGCILVEFFTGDALFQTHNNLEHLAMMEVVMGKMPQRMTERGRFKKPEFFRGNKVDFPNSQTEKSSKKFVKSLKSLKEIIGQENRARALFLDLVTRLLDFDPDMRISVGSALNHPYLREDIPEPPPPPP
ncbi:dual specificity protein kinase kns1 [Saitozyma podzolica]|uniref:Dual specificity protein kinase kns1 n=1 Tax=Saitozyma podzolica TaxID=1890683 RepID=A0A427Y2I1_9TREE|nr:dual specificity protein kinase kns1 [Saitozyma podzolica]